MFLPISLQLDILCMLNISCIYSYIQSSFVFSYRLSVTFAFDNYHCFILFLYIYMYIYFIRDVRQPLSQIRLSLSASLGAGQIIFLAGINATENMVSCISWKKLLFNTSDFSQPGSCSFFLFCRLLVSQQQLLCSIFWWPLSVGCWLKEFISTCLL